MHKMQHNVAFPSTKIKNFLGMAPPQTILTGEGKPHPVAEGRLSPLVWFLSCTKTQIRLSPTSSFNCQLYIRHVTIRHLSCGLRYLIANWSANRFRQSQTSAITTLEARCRFVTVWQPSWKTDITS